MAVLGKWKGGVKAQGNLPEVWTAPTSLFDTEDRNDASSYVFTALTSTLTLPPSGLADGYLLIGAFEYQDTSNGRFNPQGKIVQTSGTGAFIGGPTGGYSRDNSEDRSYVRAWAFVDGPSTSSTFQFQWKADVDDATGGTERSVFEVIPLYYSDVGIYGSTDSALLGGTTPVVIGTWTTSLEGVNITRSSNIVTVTGDNKRYLVFASQFFEGRGGRTQRWHGLDIDGVQENAAKAYSYYRSTSDDESGDLFTWLLETTTASITIEQTCYRGDGIASGQGGADVDGSTPTVGDHSLVVLELNDSAEVFRNTGSTNQNFATTGPIDVQASKVGDVDFNDSSSFTRTTDIGMNAEVAMDALVGANISSASQAVASGARYTGYGELTVDGVEDANTFSGDYLRNNQGSIDTFGWSANLLSFQALAQNEDIGVSVTELPGSEGGGGAVHSQVGWVGFWGINLDTLVGGGVSYVDMIGALDTATTITADAQRLRNIVGTLDSGAIISGTIKPFIGVSSSLTTSSSIAATLKAMSALQAVLTTGSTTSVDLNKAKGLVGVLNGTSSIASDMRRLRGVYAVFGGTSSMVADIKSLAALQSTLSGASSINANINVVVTLSSVFYGTSSIDTTLSSLVAIVATLSGNSGINTTLSSLVALNTILAGSTTVAADLKTITSLQALLGGTSSIDGDIVKLVTLGSSLVGSTSINALLKKTMTLQVSLGGGSAVEGLLTKYTALTVGLIGSTLLAATPSLYKGLVASLDGSGVVSGDLVRLTALQASLGGQASIISDLVVLTNVIYIDLLAALNTQAVIGANISRLRGVVSVLPSSSRLGGNLEIIQIFQSLISDGLVNTIGTDGRVDSEIIDRVLISIIDEGKI